MPKASSPQSLNRYSWVVGNPLRYIDPSGHCYGDPGDGKDDACWDAYFQATGILGSGFDFLGQWSLADLRSLLGWATQGVRFTSDAGLAWTDANMRDVLSALHRVESVLGAITQQALGLVGAARLTFNKVASGPSNYSAPTNTIHMRFDKPTQEQNVETAIHEMGHTVDWYARPGNSQWGWSASATEWQQATGWRHHYEHGYWYTGDVQRMQGVPTNYARTNPGEDFADTVLWHVESGNFHRVRTSADQVVVAPRIDALLTALSEFR
ncbi:MAG: hypothetical protein JXM73_20465 [Anaerolineae bacterium]|nr:hypothetical protein [Anaerolineae bacterium]